MGIALWKRQEADQARASRECLDKNSGLDTIKRDAAALLHTVALILPRLDVLEGRVTELTRRLTQLDTMLNRIGPELINKIGAMSTEGVGTVAGEVLRDDLLNRNSTNVMLRKLFEIPALEARAGPGPEGHQMCPYPAMCCDRDFCYLHAECAELLCANHNQLTGPKVNVE